MQRGFVLLFAILVSSVILAVGMGAFNITLKELALSAAGRDSQVAFYYADTGSECAFFWDRKHPNFDDTVFEYEGSSLLVPDGVRCGDQDVAATGGDPSGFSTVSGWPFPAAPKWFQAVTEMPNGFVEPDPPHSAIETRFVISKAAPGARENKPCAKVTVSKRLCQNLGGFVQTTITSEGYSACNPTSPRTVKRTMTNIYPSPTAYPCN